MNARRKITAFAGAAVAVLAVGCDTGTQVTKPRADARTPASQPIAIGTHVARCESAMIGNMRISDAEWRRDYNSAGRFALLEHRKTFKFAQPAGGQLAPAFRDVLITKIPATVRGSGAVTVSIPAGDRSQAGSRSQAGLLYGSLGGYTRPYAQIRFVPCEGYAGTSWPGGLALRARRPVTILVQTEGSSPARQRALTVGG